MNEVIVPDERKVAGVIDAACRTLVPIFRQMGWTWYGRTEPPTWAEMYEWVENLVETAINSTDNMCSYGTGRICVSKYVDIDYPGQYDIDIKLDIAEDDVF